jgi:hypothetical protein
MSFTGGMSVSREQVLAYRVGVHGFDRASKDPDVLALGVQDTPHGSARLALAARGADAAPLTRVWATRGAPHLVRDVPALARALWPVSDADATKRINVTPIKEGARLGVAAFVAAAEAFREVVTGPMAKGEVSTAVSALVPRTLTFWCATCGAQHISGSLFQQAGLFGGVSVSAEGGTTIAPLADRFPIPDGAEGTAEFVRTFLRFLGPATPAEVAKFLGTSQAVVRQVWPEDLDEVTVEGVKMWIPDAAALRAAEIPQVTRLLPPGDPLLQSRSLLAPDKAREKEIWRALGNPGVVLVNTEIAGTWRAKLTGRRLDLTVTPFGPLPDLRAEADVVGEARGVAEVRLHVNG